MRLGLLPDFEEENWPSMDLTAARLREEIDAGRAGDVAAENLRPEFKRRFTRIPGLRGTSMARNADRFLNRMRDYPRHIRNLTDQPDCFHVCDHAYANLLHVLPANRSGVFCHDLDTFRCLLEPAAESRPRWFKRMAREILEGLQKAAVVFHTTLEVRRQILEYKLLDASRLVHAPLGVSPIYNSRTALAPDSTNPVVRKALQTPFLLHVGSCMARKRIDVLLDVVAGLKAKHPALRLVKVGGPWSSAQSAQLARLNLADACTQINWLDQENLAELYRRATLVLQPSAAEGFGIPVIEALACGSALIASDIPTLREAGGAGALYCPVGAIESWVAMADQILLDPGFAPPRELRLQQAAKFNWTAHALTICDSYRGLLGQTPAKDA